MAGARQVSDNRERTSPLEHSELVNVLSFQPDPVAADEVGQTGGSGLERSLSHVEDV